MSAQFTLNWDNTGVAGSGNVTGQVAAYRKRSVGGAFITTGFTPANPINKSINTANSPSTLDYNCVYEFKIDAQCTVNGPTINSNGIREQIVFDCSIPKIVTQTDIASQIVINVTGLDVVKARFTLKLDVDDSVILVPTIINKIGNTITATVSGLDQSTTYRWEIELYAQLGADFVISSDSDHLGSVCASTFTTLATVDCPAPESLTVTKNA